MTGESPTEAPSYEVHCDCGAVALRLHGAPLVHAVCHCSDCRDLLNIPYNALAAWDGPDVQITRGASHLIEYAYPGKTMKRYVCDGCGATLFNTNAYGWGVVAQALLRKCHADRLPPELESDKHFFYAERIVDISDALPKFLRGVDGPLYEDAGT
jgi:hypothetical protein